MRFNRHLLGYLLEQPSSNVTDLLVPDGGTSAKGARQSILHSESASALAGHWQPLLEPTIAWADGIVKLTLGESEAMTTER